jgi:hypothetical protein
MSEGDTTMTVAAKRLPLRAIPEPRLRTAWSEGHPYYPWTEREPLGHEKPIEEQSLLDLIGDADVAAIEDGLAGKRPPVNYGEPLSESRRAWLQAGFGVLSANIRRLFGDEGESVELIEVIPDDPERNSQVYRWTPFTTVDPAMQGRILKEQQYAFSSGDVRVVITAREDGSLQFDTPNRKFSNTEAFKNAVKGLLAYFGRPKTLADLHAKIDLLRDALESDPDMLRYRSAYAPEERWRFVAPAHPVWETSHEVCRDGRVVATVWRGEGRDRQYDLWHAKGRDIVELELGTELIGDRELETLLGQPESAFDADGELIR